MGQVEYKTTARPDRGRVEAPNPATENPAPQARKKMRKEYLHKTPEKKIGEFQVYLICDGDTFHTKTTIHELEGTRVYYLLYNKTNYFASEVERLNHKLNHASCNFMFLEGFTKVDCGLLTLGNADFSEAAWDEIGKNDDNKIWDTEAEGTFWRPDYFTGGVRHRDVSRAFPDIRKHARYDGGGWFCRQGCRDVGGWQCFDDSDERDENTVEWDVIKWENI
jgi:hypothetical protein